MDIDLNKIICYGIILLSIIPVSASLVKDGYQKKINIMLKKGDRDVVVAKPEGEKKTFIIKKNNVLTFWFYLFIYLFTNIAAFETIIAGTANVSFILLTVFTVLSSIFSILSMKSLGYNLFLLKKILVQERRCRS